MLARDYVEKKNTVLLPTGLGITVNNLLRQFFPDILSLDFTAELEDRLDLVGEGKLEWRQVVGGFYAKFSKDVEVAQREMDMVAVEDEHGGKKEPVWQVPRLSGLSGVQEYQALTD